MADKFNENDDALAEAMGWKLEHIYDTRGYLAFAVVPSSNSKFKNGHEARQFVWDAAKQGNKLCRRALTIVTQSELVGKTKPPKKARK
ncbi:hypothetical protein [Comamonas aquatica]|uniref:hypothetical protein n=1 Tax=Comamonas aquatica TaxID=225991 RepID=UPI00244680D2|nr:hypothetical protein [Comamonas aquatica]MDH0200694.1 hypothetical protein [Comamonas aquatica]MDH1445566.1 hypothetical protein [Comamonas aquatica]